MVVRVGFASVIECVTNLSGAFKWNDTPQGYDYWHGLYHGFRKWDDEAYENVRILIQQSIDFYGVPYKRRKL